MLLLFGILIIAKCIYNRNLPLFSLSFMTDENSDAESNNQSWNMKYLIVNKGGKMAGGRIRPRLCIGLKVVSKFEGYDYKYGFFDIELHGFYEDSYFFDDQNNTVSIFETEADKLITLISFMEGQLEKSDMYIDMYAIKNSFEIDYTDCFGVDHQEFYESENNYSYMLTGWGEKENTDYNDGELVRYCSDNALVKAREIDTDIFSYSLLDGDSSYIEWIAKDNVKYIKKHQNEILQTNAYNFEEVEEINGNVTDIPTEELGTFVDAIVDDAGLLIGLHRFHDGCNNKDDVQWYERVKDAFYDLMR